MAGFYSQPFGGFHAGQSGGLCNRAADGLAALLDICPNIWRQAWRRTGAR